jgi:hypothetical protein
MHLAFHYGGNPCISIFRHATSRDTLSPTNVVAGNCSDVHNDYHLAEDTPFLIGLSYSILTLGLEAPPPFHGLTERVIFSQSIEKVI